MCHQGFEELKGIKPPPSPWRDRPIEDSLKLFEVHISFVSVVAQAKHYICVQFVKYLDGLMCARISSICAKNLLYLCVCVRFMCKEGCACGKITWICTLFSCALCSHLY